jgi:riboflavin synthase
LYGSQPASGRKKYQKKRHSVTLIARQSYTMFTGIVESIGKVIAISQTSSGARLRVDIGNLASDVKMGGSVAINGVCLSAVGISGTTVDFDVVYESLARTNLGALSPGSPVNVERPLKVSDRIEGHFVQGHIDTTCRIVQWQSQGAGRLLTLELSDPQCVCYIVPKGSVALDGISLTVASVAASRFVVALIPTTVEKTTILTKPIGAVVNFEADILVKAVVHLHRQIAGSDDQLMDTLHRSGFVP